MNETRTNLNLIKHQVMISQNYLLPMMIHKYFIHHSNNMGW